VDEASAFASLEQFPKTLQALRASGEPAPWVNHSGVKTLSLVHHLSNWVWGLGGDFVTPNGRQVAFNSPAARVGIRQYFELQRFITPEAQGLNDNQASERYFRGQAAVTLCAASGVRRLFEGSFPPEVVANTGVAVPPGVPFVGGSNWVIWSHIPRNLESAALEFIAHITSKEAQMRLFEDTGQLPARLKALLPIMDDAHYAPVLKTLLKGRPFPSTHLWGIVEERLTDALFRISETLQGNPDADLEAILDEHLSPLEKRLNLTLSS
jgi:ABC-type glycerol-3-phosphate transport system substrate-binding protein